MRHLIGMRPCVQLNGLADSDIAKLIYRDSIRLKHASRKRLADEISAKPSLPFARERNKTDAENRAVEDQHPLSKALVAYLLEACDSWDHLVCFFSYMVIQ